MANQTRLTMKTGITRARESDTHPVYPAKMRNRIQET
jgi:hypothetical protein